MLVSAFILGILGSFHCVGMCGPIAFMLPVDHSNSLKKLSQITIYHFGRLLAYSIIGVVFGLIGSSLNIFGLQQHLSIFIGFLMIIIVLLPKKTIGRHNLFAPIYRLISKLKLVLGMAFKKRTMDTFLTIGFLNGFLPCGLVYMAILASIAFGSPLSSAFYMLVFGLGTIPLMTTSIYASQFLKHSGRNYIQKLIPAFVILVGALFILRGLGLGIPYLSPSPIENLITGAVNCH